MKLYFENSTGVAGRYELPGDFMPRFSAFVRRKNYKPRYGRDGSAQVADGKIQSRKLSLNYMATSGDVPEIVAGGGADYGDANQTKDEAYRGFIGEIIAFFRPALGPFHLVDTDANGGDGLQAEVDFISSLDEWQPGAAMRIGLNDLEFEWIGAVWEDISEQTLEDTAGITNGDTITIENTGLLEAFPVFTFTALNTVETIRIKNSTNGQFFTYSNLGFSAGSVLIVDGTGDEFIVTLDGVDTTFALLDGSTPIELDPGTSILEYESLGDVQYDISYLRRFPI